MDTKYCGNEKVSIKVDGKYPLAMMFRSQWRSKRHLPIVSDLLNLFGFDCKLKCAGGASEVETTTSTTSTTTLTSTSTSTSTSASTSSPTSTPAPVEPLPSVPDYEPSSKPEPLKFCKCRPGVTNTPAPPTTQGLTPYLLTTKPGLTPTLLSSISSTSKHPHLMTTRPSFGFTGMTSGSPSRYLRRRGQLLKLFL